jgi:hypothetical protein
VEEFVLFETGINETKISVDQNFQPSRQRGQLRIQQLQKQFEIEENNKEGSFEKWQK